MVVLCLVCFGAFVQAASAQEGEGASNSQLAQLLPQLFGTPPAPAPKPPPPKAPAAKPPAVGTPPTRSPQPPADQAYKQRLNSWTVGLAAGRMEGTQLQLAAELAQVLDDGDAMRVVPMVTRGPTDNVLDLLYLRGVDAAIVYGDVLDHVKSKPELAHSWRRITYLLNLFAAEVQVLARPEINSLQDLSGKVVNFNMPGTAAHTSGPLIFKRLGIQVKAASMPDDVAMERMLQGDEVEAILWMAPKPLAAVLKGDWPEGFKLLPIEHSQKLDYYTPAYLDHADYPDLITEGQQVATVSVPAVLAVYDRPGDADHQRRLARLVDYLMQRFERLQTEPGHHDRWKDVHLAGTVPGWQRYKPLQDRLDKANITAPAPIRPAQGRAQTLDAAPVNPAAQEQLFKQFLEWNKNQQQNKR